MPGTLENVIIKTQRNCVSDRRSYGGHFIPIVHEYVQDEPLVYPLLMTCRHEGDTQDMPCATWRDILAGAMEALPGASPLEAIYEKVWCYKRAQTHRHWRDKVRQTLQYNPNVFFSPARGNWKLRKYA